MASKCINSCEGARVNIPGLPATDVFSNRDLDRDRTVDPSVCSSCLRQKIRACRSDILQPDLELVREALEGRLFTNDIFIWCLKTGNRQIVCTSAMTLKILAI